MANKRGNIMNIVWIVGVLFTLMFIALLIAFGGMIMDWGADIIVPQISNLGMVGNSNLTQTAGYTISPVNTFIQAYTWLGGLAYALALASCIGMAFIFRFTGNKWLLGFFIACMLMLVVASIFISNIYQDFYDDSSADVGGRLRSQTMLSYLILYSPIIMIIIGFICGIIMFTGEGEETQIL